MIVLRNLALTVLAIIVFWAAIIALSYVAFPPSDARLIDTEVPERVIYSSETKWVVYGRDALARPGRKVIFLGPSNVREGFRPFQISPLIGGVEVQNLAVGASNQREVDEIVDLVYDAIPKGQRANVTFVMGIWYGNFVDNAMRWDAGRTNIDLEFERYGLWSRGADGRYTPRLPPSLLPAAFVLLRPIMWFGYAYNWYVLVPWLDLVDRIETRLGKPQDTINRNDRATAVLTERQRRIALDYFAGYMGGSGKQSDEQLVIFENICRRITANGSRLMIVDLPIPKWHRDGLPYEEEWNEQKIPYLNRVRALPGVAYYNLQYMSANGDFYDSAHPRPQVSIRWAHAIAPTLRTLLSSPVAYTKPVAAADDSAAAVP